MLTSEQVLLECKPLTADMFRVSVPVLLGITSRQSLEDDKPVRMPWTLIVCLDGQGMQQQRFGFRCSGRATIEHGECIAAVGFTIDVRTLLCRLERCLIIPVRFRALAVGLRLVSSRTQFLPLWRLD